MDNETIKIPKFSLTAFRLTYSTPEKISQSSKCLLLGGIPDIWLEERAPGFLASTTHYAKNKIKARYRDASNLINGSIRNASGGTVVEEGAFNLYLNRNQPETKEAKSIIKVIEMRDDLSDEVDNDDDHEDHEEQETKSDQDSESSVERAYDPTNTTSMSSMSVNSQRPELKSPVGSYFKEKVSDSAQLTRSILRASVSMPDDVDFTADSPGADMEEEPSRFEFVNSNLHSNSSSGSVGESIPRFEVADADKNAEFETPPSLYTARSVTPPVLHGSKPTSALKGSNSSIHSKRSILKSSSNSSTSITPPSLHSTNSITPPIITIHPSHSPTNSNKSDLLQVGGATSLSSTNSTLSSPTSLRFNQSINSNNNLSVNSIKHPLRKPSVKFAISKTNSRRSRVSVTMPQPQDAIDMKDLGLEAKKHNKFLRRLKSFTKLTHTRGNTSKIEALSKLNSVIVQRFKAGEILRQAEMLVLTKEILNSNQPWTFTDNENADSRVHERWTEYHLVLRRTANVKQPLAIEFYDIRDDPTDKSKRPEFHINLGTGVDAHLYCDSDKSLCITTLKNQSTFAYIIKSHNQIGAIRFLYFLKQSLGDKLNSCLNITVPDLNLSMVMKIPYPVLIKALNHRTELSIRVKPQGYELEYSPILAYVRKMLFEELKSRKSEIFDRWMAAQVNPWLCFKTYDRIEWVMNNSELFFLQNQVLSSRFRLECRDMSHYCSTTTSPAGDIIEEPTPIEGFLSRLTNSNGKGTAFMRTFHKLSYFYTNDHLLFYTNYIKGVPPSPGNELMHENGNHLEVRSKMPQIYEHNPFEIDCNGHIPWLNQEDFGYHDQIAVEELERRSHLLVKADSMLDMCLIRDIRSIPLSRVTKTHRLFLNLLWYSSPEIPTDESIIDSSFEIEMINGSILKLQAPSAKIRDEWVSRLWELRVFWLARKQDDIMRMVRVRDANEKLLRFNEYIDSNVMMESNFYEMHNSIADPLIHNIDSIAMSRCILMSGYLYQKNKKHADFTRYFVVLCPGFLSLYSIFKRSKKTGMWKKTPAYEHYFTIAISQCYIYSGNLTSMDLLERQKNIDSSHPQRHSLPRIYPDGWKSSEEESLRCFTLWIGKKRNIKKKGAEVLNKDEIPVKSETADAEFTPNNRDKTADTKATTRKNPGLATMIKRLGLTGKSIVFMARSRQEREIWTYKILSEIDRYSG